MKYKRWLSFMGLLNISIKYQHDHYPKLEFKTYRELQT